MVLRDNNGREASQIPPDMTSSPLFFWSVRPSLLIVADACTNTFVLGVGVACSRGVRSFRGDLPEGYFKFPININLMYVLCA